MSLYIVSSWFLTLSKLTFKISKRILWTYSLNSRRLTTFRKVYRSLSSDFKTMLKNCLKRVSKNRFHDFSLSFESTMNVVMSFSLFESSSIHQFMTNFFKQDQRFNRIFFAFFSVITSLTRRMKKWTSLKYVFLLWWAMKSSFCTILSSNREWKKSNSSTIQLTLTFSTLTSSRSSISRNFESSIDSEDSEIEEFRWV